MRHDPSVRALKTLLDEGRLGEPVLATIEMRAIPHWMPWARDGRSLSTFIMSIHHLDTFRYWLGDPVRVLASTRPDPRTTFDHADGINLYVLEYEGGARASGWDDVWSGPAREGSGSSISVRWRFEGTEGLAMGEIGWPGWPARVPSTIDYTTTRDNGEWRRPRWPDAWFPDAFAGTMGGLLRALESGDAPDIPGPGQPQYDRAVRGGAGRGARASRGAAGRIHSGCSPPLEHEAGSSRGVQSANCGERIPERSTVRNGGLRSPYSILISCGHGPRQAGVHLDHHHAHRIPGPGDRPSRRVDGLPRPDGGLGLRQHSCWSLRWAWGCGRCGGGACGRAGWPSSRRRRPSAAAPSALAPDRGLLLHAGRDAPADDPLQGPGGAVHLRQRAVLCRAGDIPRTDQGEDRLRLLPQGTGREVSRRRPQGPR